jgi:hypothetical protein
MSAQTYEEFEKTIPYDDNVTEYDWGKQCWEAALKSKMTCNCGQPAVRSHCPQCIENMLNCVD